MCASLHNSSRLQWNVGTAEQLGLGQCCYSVCLEMWNDTYTHTIFIRTIHKIRIATEPCHLYNNVGRRRNNVCFRCFDAEKKHGLQSHVLNGNTYLRMPPLENSSHFSREITTKSHISIFLKRIVAMSCTISARWDAITFKYWNSYCYQLVYGFTSILGH